MSSAHIVMVECTFPTTGFRQRSSKLVTLHSRENLVWFYITFEL